MPRYTTSAIRWAIHALLLNRLGYGLGSPGTHPGGPLVCWSDHYLRVGPEAVSSRDFPDRRTVTWQVDSPETGSLLGDIFDRASPPAGPSLPIALTPTAGVPLLPAAPPAPGGG